MFFFSLSPSSRAYTHTKNSTSSTYTIYVQNDNITIRTLQFKRAHQSVLIKNYVRAIRVWSPSRARLLCMMSARRSRTVVNQRNRFWPRRSLLMARGEQCMRTVPTFINIVLCNINIYINVIVIMYTRTTELPRCAL